MEISDNFLTPYYQRQNQKCQEHLASLNLPIAGKTVLEVGAGIGDHTAFFINRKCPVTSTDGRQELLSILQQRFPEVATFVWDIESRAPKGIKASQIVYAYGVLYHTSDPRAVLENLASLCSETLLLETCVSFGDEELVNLVDEDSNDPTQALGGKGCRPTRSWIFKTLKCFFPFVYVTKTQPWHEAFPINWNKSTEKNYEGKPSRCVFVASKVLLHNENLSLELIDEQSYVQNREDVILRRIFGDKKTGFYIDIGAFHPETLSVTKYFHDQGWCGIEVDPSKENFDLFSKYNHDPVDFMKIHVEGGEYNVLSSIDFHRCRPKVLLIAATIPNSTLPGGSDLKSLFNFKEWEEALLSSGYIFAYFDGLNRFYVSEENKHLLDCFQIGLCLWDDFVSPQQVSLTSEFEWHLAERMKQIESLTKMLKESEVDRAARGEQIDSLSKMLKEPEADRAVQKEQIESILENIGALFSRLQFRWLTRFVNWPEVKELAEQLVESSLIKKPLKTVVIDLTPVLPGGYNGGAKIVVLELLSHLAKIAPQVKFVLLTQADSHKELSILDRSNMRRVMIIGPKLKKTFRSYLLSPILSVSAYLPRRLKKLVSRLSYALSAMLKHNGSRTLLHQMGADLLFCPFTAPTYFELGIPTVCMVHDLQHKTYPEFFAPEELAHRNRVFVDACQRATLIAAVSNYSGKVAIEHGGLNHDRVRIIHHRLAQRISSVTESDHDILGRLGLVKGQYLFYPANFWKHKNHEMLLTAFGMACHGRLAANIKLVCTGTAGERQAWLMNAACVMGLNNRIVFSGYLNKVEFASLMLNCKGMLFPSLYEGFGLPVIEAMAFGIPVACSNIASLPEVAADAAIFFDPRVPAQMVEAIIALTEDDALCARLIQAGRKRALEFSDAQRMAREYLELFHSALAKRKPRNLLVGIYSDDWVGPVLNIQVAPTANAQMLEIEFLAPEWLPHPKVIVQSFSDDKELGLPFELLRGSSGIIALPIGPMGGCFKIHISPTFIPAHSGDGNDQRELALIYKRGGILSGSGKYIEMVR